MASNDYVKKDNQAKMIVVLHFQWCSCFTLCFKCRVLLSFTAMRFHLSLTAKMCSQPGCGMFQQFYTTR